MGAYSEAYYMNKTTNYCGKSKVKPWMKVKFIEKGDNSYYNRLILILKVIEDKTILFD